MADQASVLRAREKAAVTGIAIVVVAAAADTVALVARVMLLQRIRDGGQVTFAEADASDDRLFAAGVALGVAVLVGGMLWLRWQHRSQKTLVDLGYLDLTFSPGWAVGWWFVPLANLVQPYRAMRELFDRSVQLRPEGPGAGSAGLLGVWWLLFIGAGLVGRIAAFDESETIDGFIRSEYTSVASNLLLAAAAVPAVMLVRQIGGRLVGYLEGGSPGSGGRRPLPPAADAS